MVLAYVVYLLLVNGVMTAKADAKIVASMDECKAFHKAMSDELNKQKNYAVYDADCVDLGQLVNM